MGESHRVSVFVDLADFIYKIRKLRQTMEERKGGGSCEHGMGRWKENMVHFHKNLLVSFGERKTRRRKPFLMQRRICMTVADAVFQWRRRENMRVIEKKHIA